ncbi:MAG: tRNA uridine-5-carboxymethylaminomethyl(34) synthesis GTPase MnmE [Terracidiphilus sp.]|nr:tRNA uridine-5-carboxymethylaminomethyl(34) synthesis GTPase MnmE [Terracidiphilus sp.]
MTTVPSTDTIAAISTPPGRGGIGIVRLSGPQAADIAAQLVALHQPLQPARARLASVLDDATPIDQALVTFFPAPHSYTADDLVEIAAHGAPVVLELLLRRALALGARLAEPGEFTHRAFLSGKLDLTQAEAVRDLIDAETLTQARQAASQLGGALSRRVLPTKQDLTDLIALLEAGIDFAEDDVEVTPPSEIARRIDALQPPLAALEASFARGRIVHDGLTLAIVGRPNAGKSSLFNQLVQRDRAIVTATPGTTRDLVSERISLDGIPLELVDTAGLRETNEEIEQLGIARSREAIADAALVLVVLDATQPLNDEEQTLLASLENRAALVALNKSDLADPGAYDTAPCPIHRAASSRDEWETKTSSQPPTPGAPGPAPLGTGETSPSVHNGAQHALSVIPTSALTGQGIDDLRRAILTLATGGAQPEPGLLTNLRQQQAIASARSALTDATQANASSIPHEMILLDLYRALWALDSLTGQTTPDDILNLIFSTFCIG